MAYRIMELRLKHGMSLIELSRKSQVSRQTIAKLEAGEEQDTTVSTLQKIADAVGVHVAELFMP